MGCHRLYHLFALRPCGVLGACLHQARHIETSGARGALDDPSCFFLLDPETAGEQPEYVFLDIHPISTNKSPKKVGILGGYRCVWI